MLNRENFLLGEDISWRTDFEDPYNFLSYMFHDRNKEKGYTGILVAFNSGHEVVTCDLPEGTWYRIIDTARAPPEDICEDEASAVTITTAGYDMQPYSCLVLKTYQDFRLLQFKIKCDCTKPGEVLCLVGSEAEVGLWDPDKAVKCETNSDTFPVWTTTVEMPRGINQFEFKLLRVGPNTVTWEDGENHEVVIDATCAENEMGVVTCAWGKPEVSYDSEPEPAETASLSSNEESHGTKSPLTTKKLGSNEEPRPISSASSDEDEEACPISMMGA
jgi:hypothetical protein